MFLSGGGKGRSGIFVRNVWEKLRFVGKIGGVENERFIPEVPVSDFKKMTYIWLKLVIMSVSHDFGKLGEAKAVQYLTEQGYHILARNWRSGHKEIDIICRDGEVVVVVEVKTRVTEEEYPSELMDYRKKHNLLRAGAAYIRQNKLEKELRFDLLVLTGPELKVQHIREAIQVFD